MNLQPNENPVRAMWLGVIYQILADLQQSKPKIRLIADEYVSNVSLGLPRLCALAEVPYDKVIARAREIQADVAENGFAKRGRPRGEDWLAEEAVQFDAMELI